MIEIPISFIVFEINLSISFAFFPFLQPIPMTYSRGFNKREVSNTSSLEVTTTSTNLSGGYGTIRTPVSSQVISCPVSIHIVISFPANTFDDTLTIPSLFAIYRLFLFANKSTANFLFRSVAVVITGTAPVFFAIWFARSFAPPICPDKIGMTYFPFSSITSTGTSCSLSVRCGATALTAIPQAPINNKAFCSCIRSFAQSPTDIFTNKISE